MPDNASRVTIHMAASLDGFIARQDGSVDWLETSDTFEGGDTMEPGVVATFLKTIDCYVMGSRTYETALNFEAKGFGWAYGDTPTFVLTHRVLPRTRDTVEFCSGDLSQFVNGRLRPSFRTIWQRSKPTPAAWLRFAMTCDDRRRAWRSGMAHSRDLRER